MNYPSIEQKFLLKNALFRMNRMRGTNKDVDFINDFVDYINSFAEKDEGLLGHYGYIKGPECPNAVGHTGIIGPAGTWEPTETIISPQGPTPYKK